MNDQIFKFIITLLFYYTIGFIFIIFLYELCSYVYISLNIYKDEKIEEFKQLILSTVKESLEPYVNLLKI
ncbi:unknown similar to AMEV169 [Adoxophyes honmai entomopoxvirus 'L']|uniref:Uncharacterized protein n=1 Tax=Adoxophyes honmai entomopoxvirus 'L' TaxID=1293540 RepID=A0A916P690_9POXV|nr:unknown similar to AMEV169 [Adoxophyes honmai entomopoxvirus 'L']CCU55485.1 unknown similar to AMEV169 [Adoxophyes honmai entomopoxvirus 'L']